MSVARSRVKQASGELGLADRTVAANADPLAAALEEIAKVEEALRTAGDAATLERFGDPGHGEALASMLGHHGVTPDHARIVDRLSWMPEGLKLARAYLAAVGPGD